MILWFYERRFLKDLRRKEVSLSTMRFFLQENIDKPVKKREPEEGGEIPCICSQNTEARCQHATEWWCLHWRDKHSFLSLLPIHEKWINKDSADEQEVCHGQQSLDNAKPGGISAHTGCCAYWTDSMGKADLTSMPWTEVVTQKSGLTLIININSDLHLDTITLENSISLLEQVRACSQTDIR